MNENKENRQAALESYNRIIKYLEMRKYSYEASEYWQEESESLQYLYSANEDIILRLRDHTHWITGVRSYEYKKHHSHMLPLFEKKLNQLIHESANLKSLGEIGVLGDFGHYIGEQLINIDTLKFYESCIALEKFGQIMHLSNLNQPVICEIGAGWGGFISHLARYIEKAKFLIVDLPSTLIFSATYLGAAFPEKTIGFYGGFDFTGEEDFIFMLPEDFLDAGFKWKIDLTTNMVSFQEMTSLQVKAYSQKIIDLGCLYLYSHNRNKSKHNAELQDIRDCLRDWDSVNEVKPLPVDYTFMNFPKNVRKKGVLPPKLSSAIAKRPLLWKTIISLFNDSTIEKVFGKNEEWRNYHHLLFSNSHIKKLVSDESNYD